VARDRITMAGAATGRSSRVTEAQAGRRVKEGRDGSSPQQTRLKPPLVDGTPMIALRFSQSITKRHWAKSAPYEALRGLTSARAGAGPGPRGVRIVTDTAEGIAYMAGVEVPSVRDCRGFMRVSIPAQRSRCSRTMNHVSKLKGHDGRDLVVVDKVQPDAWRATPGGHLRSSSRYGEESRSAEGYGRHRGMGAVKS